MGEKTIYDHKFLEITVAANLSTIQVPHQDSHWNLPANAFTYG